MSVALATLREYRGNMPLAASRLFKVRNKAGQIVPFIMNEAQFELHRQLEEQRERTGMVRALILKGRQQGVSTYTQARYYHRSSLFTGVNVYILTHEQAATDNLFNMVDLMHTHNPLGPHVGKTNAKELEFDKLNSSYAVATAGVKAAGRGRTTSLFHGSEVAFWPNAADHFAASVQSVPMERDTEVLLESTSAGPSGEFYERFNDAMTGESDYIAVFLPWWLSKEYRREPPPGFSLSREAEQGVMSEFEYAKAFGLDLWQMAWRRFKISELRSPLLFQREYPATANEAWTAPPDKQPFIDALTVLRSRKRSVEGAGPLVVGVDPASNGGDRFCVCWRRGPQMEKFERRKKVEHNEAVAWLREIIERDKPARMVIDAGNIGAGIISSLKAISPEIAEVVRGVNFGGTSQFKMATPKQPGPLNRRAEMYARMRDWLGSEVEVSIPDSDELQADLTAPMMEPKENNDFLIESKVKMKARKVRSPDLADALALTFAFREFFKDYAPARKVSSYGDLRPDQAPALQYDPGLGGYGWMA